MGGGGAVMEASSPVESCISGNWRLMRASRVGSSIWAAGWPLGIAWEAMVVVVVV